MNILFVHNNFPAQFRHLAQRFLRISGIQVQAIGASTAPSLPGIATARYTFPAAASQAVHAFGARFDLDCRRAEQILYEAVHLKSQGFVPQLIYVHPGWGEALPLRTLFPDATICVLAEFYYAPRGTDVGFDPEFVNFGVDGEVRIALRNASTLMALVDCDYAIAPTAWQRSVFPRDFENKIHVVHDGLDLAGLVPAGKPASFSLPGLDIGADEEIITFVSRNLEPYRGFHIFMRSLPELLSRRPRARVMIVGGEGVSYGAMPNRHSSWRNVMLEELGDRIDLRRVHFLGVTDYQNYLALLRRSDTHVYLTYPFVLSWSMLEAMAMECLVIASDTPPVTEVIQGGHNGLLVPFFDPSALARTLSQALDNPSRLTAVRKAARQTILSRYDFESVSWPRHVALLRKYCRSDALLRLVEADFAQTRS